MSDEMDSLIRMARWGRDQGKQNIIADLGPLCEMADEIDRLKGDLEEHRTAAEYYAAALGVCEAKLTHAHDELSKAKEAIACLEAANAEFARIAAESIRPIPGWTSTPPTEPADYWARGPRLTHGPELVRLYRVDSGEMRMDEGRIVPDDLEWWGPVPRPPEKREGLIVAESRFSFEQANRITHTITDYDRDDPTQQEST